MGILFVIFLLFCTLRTCLSTSFLGAKNTKIVALLFIRGMFDAEVWVVVNSSYGFAKYLYIICFM